MRSLIIPTWGLSPPCPPPYFSPAWAHCPGFWWWCRTAALLLLPALLACGLVCWAVPVPREVTEGSGGCLLPALLRSCLHWRSFPALQDYIMIIIGKFQWGRNAKLCSPVLLSSRAKMYSRDSPWKPSRAGRFWPRCFQPGSSLHITICAAGSDCQVLWP